MKGCSSGRTWLAALLVLVTASLAGSASTALADAPPVPILAKAPTVLNASTSSNGSGGNGGNSSSASTSTHTFSPPSYVDYNSLGGEPTTVVDRYSFPGSNTSAAAQCPPGESSCFKDLIYVSNPLGVGYPDFSQFYKSSDGGASFRIPAHDPFTEAPLQVEAGGGGDSHLAIGQTSHSVFFVDLSGACVTMNISRDLGETFSSNKLGCETNPGAIDDRPWVAADETGGLHNVYMNVNNDTGCLATNEPGCAIVFVKSTDDGGANTPADFAASSCNEATALQPAPTGTAATACPDPADPNFIIAGPVTVDTSSSSTYWHNLYIPFERFNSSGTGEQLWVAISRDQGSTWTQQEVADLGAHDAANIFPELTVDQAGNLYYTWSQTRSLNTSTPANEGETDVYYAYSTGGGTTGTWSAPIDLTKETGDSAVFPWMVAGSPGKVDLVYYKANTGLNPNIAYYDSNGNSCDPSTQTGCRPNTSQWNTYFAQSQNALNPGADFRSVQISPHPIHQGGVCTAGIACQSTAQQNRDLLDFLTIDVNHLGAANVTWADDNNSYHDTRQFFSRQLSGSSIFDGQTIADKSSWPTRDHSADDPAGDVYTATGTPASSCPGMDLLGSSATRSGDTLTVTLTLNGPPSSSEATTCSGAGASGGLWGAEFWAPSAPVSDSGPYGGNENFYLAYRDNPPDGAPAVEAGALNSISPTFTHLEFDRYEAGTPAAPTGTCSATPPPTGPCTLVLSASLSGLGIKPGAALDSLSGFSVYQFGPGVQAPGTRAALGNSDLADAVAPFDLNGTGRTG